MAMVLASYSIQRPNKAIRAMDLSDDKQDKRRRRTGSEEHEDHQKTALDILPHELALEIISRLPIKTLMQFRSVCRPWRGMAKDPNLAKIHFFRTANKIPGLIVYADIPLQSQISFIDISSHDEEVELAHQIHVPFGEVMPEFDIIGSCNGMLCLRSSLFHDPIFVYNPFTQACLELPKSVLSSNGKKLPKYVEYGIQEVVFGFGYHPKVCEYKVVKIAYYRNSRDEKLLAQNSHVQVFTLGSNLWRSIGKIPYLLDGHRPSEALVNGRLHWVTRRQYLYQIVSFDLADEQFRKLQGPVGIMWNCLGFSLAVVDGYLTATIELEGYIMEIWMLKDYDVQKSWTKCYQFRPKLPQGLFKNNPEGSLPLYGKIIRLLCRLKTGEILLECMGRALLSCDPMFGKCTVLTYDKMPKSFQAVVHVCCLNWIDTPIDNASLEIKELSI